MPILQLNDIQLHYEEYGSGPALFLVHGFSGAGVVWSNFVPAFAENYRVIVPDLRGHGGSTGNVETIHHNRFAADLLALMDALDLETAHFVGHSSGGMCLLFIGEDAPQRANSLTLVSATYTFDERAKAYMRKVADELESQPAAIEISRKLHGAVHGEDCWKKHRQAFRNFTLDARELPFQPADLARIPVPVFILHGDRDEFFPVDIPSTLYNAIPNAELCILPKTTHGLPTERSELLIRLVSEFLERASRAARPA